MSDLQISKFTINVLQNPLAITCEDGCFSYCNAAYLKLIGRSEAELIGSNFEVVVPAQFARLELAAQKKLMQLRSRHIEYDVEFTDLHPFKIRVFGHKSILLDHAGRYKGIFTVFQIDPFIFYDVLMHRYELTVQEANVLRLLNEGYLVQDIAKRMAISNHTVAGYMKIIYGKMGLNSRAELQYLTLRAALSPLD